jgi:hypothetical protein
LDSQLVEEEVQNFKMYCYNVKLLSL